MGRLPVIIAGPCSELLRCRSACACPGHTGRGSSTASGLAVTGTPAPVAAEAPFLKRPQPPGSQRQVDGQTIGMMLLRKSLDLSVTRPNGAVG